MLKFLARMGAMGYGRMSGVKHVYKVLEGGVHGGIVMGSGSSGGANLHGIIGTAACSVVPRVLDEVVVCAISIKSKMEVSTLINDIETKSGPSSSKPSPWGNPPLVSAISNKEENNDNMVVQDNIVTIPKDIPNIKEEANDGNHSLSGDVIYKQYTLNVSNGEKLEEEGDEEYKEEGEFVPN
ncbi:hypothetical protein MA16_Dca026555 [Dendrobium catenatum]|uniref:Uncharacterized protein n=1 Tax=Dendrobium catenatum TaxID=906689 RepID=A0A2I0WP17_9ASPA|nr:hypothetical protein MA16_Dca026555 [Dendrobium catenatum]